jgi:hypothetical protein
VNSLELAHLWSGVHFFGYYFVERQKSNGKPGREYSGEVFVLKRLLNLHAM